MNKKVIKKNKFNTKNGYSIVEVVIAISVFTIIISGVVLLFIGGLESISKSTVRSQAILLSAEGLEIVKSLAIEDFGGELLGKGTSGSDFIGRIQSNLQNSTYELISGEPEVIIFTYENNDDSETFRTFKRTIKISEIETNATATTSKKIVESIVSWDNNYSVGLYTLITGWRN